MTVTFSKVMCRAGLADIFNCKICQRSPVKVLGLALSLDHCGAKLKNTGDIIERKSMGAWQGWLKGWELVALSEEACKVGNQENLSEVDVRLEKKKNNKPNKRSFATTSVKYFLYSFFQEAFLS